jgi:hypothetical protein
MLGETDMSLSSAIFDKITAPIGALMPHANDEGASLPVAYVSDSLRHAEWVLRMEGATFKSATSGILKDGREFVIILSYNHQIMIAGRRFSEVRRAGSVDIDILADVKSRSFQ